MSELKTSQETQRVFKEDHRIEVDGKTSAIPVKRVFRNDKGTGEITIKISTKQISPKEVYKNAVLELVEMILSTEYDALLGLMEDFARENPQGDPGQLSIEEGGNKADDSVKAVSAPKNARAAKK